MQYLYSALYLKQLKALLHMPEIKQYLKIQFILVHTTLFLIYFSLHRRT